jgi:hypothetical protein
MQPKFEYQLLNRDLQLLHSDHLFHALNFQIIYTSHNLIRAHL